ncbi:hypothetical protein UJ101_01466 [Flavobacteriaceae bacterium UJ101]|nr:hypothetical protein UJ101_01466 [Flavobacteriaceae bacterium UJ101]
MKTLFQYRFFIFSFILSLSILSAQETISYNTFITELQKKSTSYKKTTSYKPNFFTEISVRSQTKDFEIGKQSYSVRFSTSNKKTRDYEKQYMSLLEKYDELDILQNEKIQLGYLTWMNSYILKKEQVLLDSLLLITDTEKKLLTNLSSSNTKLFNDLLKNKETTLDIQLKKELNIAERQLNEETLHSLLEKKDVVFDYNSFHNHFSIENFKEKLNDNDSSYFTKKNTEIEELLYKEKLLDLSHNLEKEKNRKIIDFFQIEAGDLDTPEFRKNVSLGIGLLIPRKKSLKEAELAIKKENLSLLKQYQNKKHQEENTYIKLQIQNLLKKHTLYKKNISLLENHTTIPKTNIDQLFAFINSRKNLLEKKMDLLKLEKEILEVYSGVFE